MPIVGTKKRIIKLKLDNKYSLTYDEFFGTIYLRYDKNHICTIWEYFEPEINKENYNYSEINKENNIITKYIIKLINLYLEEENENNKKEKENMFSNLKNIILNNGKENV